MGNIAISGHCTAKLQQLIKAKYSFLSSESSAEVIQEALAAAGDICRDLSTPDVAKTLGSKEVRFGMQIVAELIDIATRSSLSLSIKLRVLEGIQNVLCIQPLCKKAVEGETFLRLLGTLTTSSVELFIGSLGVIIRAMKVLDDDNANALLFQTLVKYSVIQKFFVFVTQSSVVGSDNMLSASIVILDIIYWSFSRTNSVLAALRPTVRSIAFQHRDSLFELSRHSVRKLSYLTQMLLIRLMISEDKVTCLAIQDAALSYGSVLWTFQKVVSDLCNACTLGVTPADSSVSASSLCTYRPGGASVEGYNCFIFTEEEDVVRSETILPAQLLLALYCMGNKTNMDTIQSALPQSMIRCLYISETDIKREKLSHTPMFPSELSSERLMAEVPLMLLHTMLPFSSTRQGDSKGVNSMKAFFKPTVANKDLHATSMSSGEYLTGDIVLSLFSTKVGQSANWALLYDHLGSVTSTPRLEWNKKSLFHLRDEIQILVDNLDFSRRLRHEAWDSTFMDIRYTRLDTMASVKGLYLKRILREMTQGTHEQFIDDPCVLAAGMLERVLVLSNGFNPNPFAPDGEKEALLCLRGLYLLLLRYPLQLQDSFSVPMLYCLLQRGATLKIYHNVGSADENSRSNSSNYIEGTEGVVVNPLWIMRVCDLLSICLKRASISDVHLFSSSGMMSWLLRIFSDIKVVSGLTAWKQIASKCQDPPALFGQGQVAHDTAIDSEDVSEAGESENGDSGNDSDAKAVPKVSCAAPSEQVIERVGSITSRLSMDTPGGQQEYSNTSKTLFSEGFERGSLSGDLVIASALNVLHRALSLTASLTADIDPELPNLQTPTGMSAVFSYVTRILWLTSVHGPFGPHGIPRCVDKMIEVVLRVLRTRKDCFLSLAQSVAFIRVLVSISIKEDGSGIMSVKIAELLSDLISGLMLLRKDELSNKLPNATTERFSLIVSPALENIREEASQGTDDLPAIDSSPLNGVGDNDAGERGVLSRQQRSSSATAVLGPVRRRSSYRETLILAATCKFSSGRTGSSADAVRFLQGVIPLQFVRLCTLLNPHNLALLFNSKVDVETAEIYLNPCIRLQYLARISRELQGWHVESFGSDYFPLRGLFESTLGSRLLDVYSSSEKTDAEAAGQLHGIYLLLFLTALPDDFLGFFNPSDFAESVVRNFDVALREFRVSFSTEVTEDGGMVLSTNLRLRTNSMSFNIESTPVLEGSDATLEQVMIYFGSLSPVRRLSVFLLSLNRIFLHWNMEKDVWYDIVFSRVCSCLSAAEIYLRPAFEAHNFCFSQFSSNAEHNRLQCLLETVLACQLSLIKSTKYLFQNGNCGSNHKSPSYERVMPILSSSLSNESLMGIFSLSIRCLQNMNDNDRNAVKEESLAGMETDIKGLFNAISALGSAFLVFFFCKVESIAREVFSRSIKKVNSTTSSTSVLEPLAGDDPKKLFRRGSMMNVMRSKQSSNSMPDVTPAFVASPAVTGIKSNDDGFAFPSEFDLTTASGVNEAARKYLFDCGGLISLIRGCRRSMALKSPLTCLHSMVALRHMLQIFPLLKAAFHDGLKSEARGGSYSMPTRSNPIVTCFHEVMDACVSSGLHLFVLDLVADVVSEQDLADAKCKIDTGLGYNAVESASLHSGVWDRSAQLSVGDLLGSQHNTSPEDDSGEADSFVPSTSSSTLWTDAMRQSNVLDQVLRNVDVLECYCTNTVRRSVSSDYSLPSQLLAEEKVQTIHSIDVDAYVFVGDSAQVDVSMMRGHISFEGVSLLSALITASAISAVWKSEESVSGSCTSFASGDIGGQDSKSKQTSLSQVVSAAVKNATGEVATSTKNSVQQLLEQLLTPSLVYVMLTDSLTFLTTIRSTISVSRPLVIWTLDMKRDMTRTVSAELRKIEEYERSRPQRREDAQAVSLYYTDCHSPDTLLMKDGFKGFYPFLSDEIAIDDVYVRLLVEPAGRDDIGARNLPRFVEEIQSSLTSTQRVIGHIAKNPIDAKHRRSSISTGSKNILTAQLKLKQKVFEHMVNLHPELGFSNLNVQDEATYF